MSLVSSTRWDALERWSGTAFLVGAVILVGAAVIAAYDIAMGTEVRLPLGQVFVGAGWTATAIGLLGLYPGLADRSRWLARAGAVCTAVGAIGYGVMAVVSFVFVLGIPQGSLESLAPFFLPPVLVGTILAYPLFGAASLRTDVHSRTVGALLFAPPVVFVANVATGSSPESILAVLVALILVFGAIGSLLRGETPGVDRAEPAPGTAGDDD